MLMIIASVTEVILQSQTTWSSIGTIEILSGRFNSSING